jgi:type II secretory pathway component PulF
LARGKEDLLPAPTKLLMAFTRFFAAVGWWAMPVGLVVGLVLLRRMYRTESGKAAMDEAALYVPVVGKLLRKIDTARFARTLAALLEGGVDIGSSLDLTAGVVHLAPFRRALRGARAEVMEGVELADALNDSRRFDPDVIAIVNSGEETGKLPESLDRVADEYEEQVTYMVKNLGSLIQPLVILILGGFVGFILVSVVMAYIAVLTSL